MAENVVIENETVTITPEGNETLESEITEVTDGKEESLKERIKNKVNEYKKKREKRKKKKKRITIKQLLNQEQSLH